jgi:hypothetical protein
MRLVLADTGGIMDTELKDNLRKRQTWLRGLYMLLFVVIYHIAEFVVGAVVLLQFIFTLVSGDTNARLLRFGQSLSLYIYQMLRFLSFNSEDMPFPFNDWPSANTDTNTKEDEVT